MSKENLIEKEIASTIHKYNRQQEKVKMINEKFDAFKKQFYKKMLDFDIDSKEIFDGNKVISATKVQSTKVTFDVPRLEKVLDKEILDEILEKQYTIHDIDGLVDYLKSCGVSPKRFKTFLNVSKTVNREKLNNLEALGLIDLESLQGAYTVTLNNPYYRVSSKEVRSEEDGQEG